VRAPRRAVAVVVALASGLWAACSLFPSLDGLTGGGDAAGDVGLPDAAPSLLGCDAPGLTAYWSFDEGTGTIVHDCSTHHLNGFFQEDVDGGLQWMDAGHNGGALWFDKASSVTLSDPVELQFTGAMTIAAWVYSAVPQTGRILSKSSAGGDAGEFGWELTLEDGPTGTQGGAGFYVARSATDGDFDLYQGSIGLPTNAWFHLAGVFDPGVELSLYVNGQLVAQAPNPPTSQYDSPYGVTMGVRPGDLCCHFEGMLDELRVFDRPLSAAEIAQLAQ
jgi:hypothetical protein